MESNPSVPLSTARGTQQPSLISPPISPSGSLLIRAPLSSDDNDPLSDSDTLTTAEDDGFETASDPGDASQEDSDVEVARRAAMPVAQLTGDDDVVDGEVFDEVLADETEGDGSASVAATDQNPYLEDDGEVLDGEMDEPSPETGVPAAVGGAVQHESPIGVLGENPKPVEDSKDGVLGENPNLAEDSKDEVLGENPNPVEDSKEGVLSENPNPVEDSKEGVLSENPNPVEDSKDGVLSESPNPVEDSKDGVLAIEEKETAEPEIFPENTTMGEAVGAEPADSVVSNVGAVDGVEENGVPDARDAKDVLLGGGSEEASSSLVVGGQSDPVEVAKDGASDVLGFDENLEGAEEPKLGGAEGDAAEVEKIGAADGADSNTNLESVSVPAAETLEMESSELNASVLGAENDGDLNGGSEAVGSELPDGSLGKLDVGNRDEVIAGVEETEKDEHEYLDRGAVAVDPEVAEDSAEKLDAVVDGDDAVDKSASPIQEVGDEKVMIEPGHASVEAEANAPLPELAASGGDSKSVQEVESRPNLAEDLRSRDTEREISENTVAIKDGNFGGVSGDPVTDLEEKPAADESHVADDDEKVDPNAAEEVEEVGLVSNGPARVAILESSETAKQIIKELEEGSSSTSTHSGFGSSRDFSHNLDGQIASDSDEELLDSDEEGDGKELFDSAALAALLKAATGGSSDGNITISSSDASRIFSVDRPAGLGSSIPSLKPAPARSTRSSLFTPSDLAVTGEPENNMDEEERKLHEKVELIRVKFLRLVQRLGHSPEDTVAAQVLYRLGLAEGIRHGRQTSRAFSLESARKKALELEMDGKEELDFSCNILVLGKTGVGKSATINSIFGEEKSRTSAFMSATASVKEIVGIVDGVKIRVIDTPGLKPSVMDQTSNRRILSSIKKYTKRYSPDIVLYVDRMDTQTRDFNDLPLLKSITSALGSSIWFNAIVALTHAASAPPDGPNGSPLSYDMFVAQRSHVVQHSIRQAAGDMRLMNPVALVENHPSCRKNREGERVLPNGLSWRPQMLLLCYSSKILSEANTLLKLQDPSPGKLFGFRVRSPPLPFLLSSLLQSRPHPKLSVDQGGENGDSDVDLDDLSDAEQEEEEDEYDELPPFKPLRKSQIAKLTKEQRRAYFDEYDYRVKLLQKKQWKEELRRMKEIKKRGKSSQDDFGFGDMAEDYDQDNIPAAVPVPLPDMVLPPSFDCDSPAYRYRFLEPTSQLLIRPVLDSHGWDHDCGYDGVSLEQNLPVLGRFPAGLSVQVTKDKKEFNIHLDSSISAKYGESGSSLAGFDIQSIGKQLAYILRAETKFKNLKKNKTAAGISVTFLGETVATGLKIEDQISIGKRVGLVASTGAVRAQGDVAYGANLEARLRDKDYPIGQTLTTLGLSLMRWRGDLALGANLQSQFSIAKNSKMAVRVGLNNKMSGQVTIRMSNSENLQIALVGILPIAMSIYRSIWPGESIPY